MSFFCSLIKGIISSIISLSFFLAYSFNSKIISFIFDEGKGIESIIQVFFSFNFLISYLNNIYFILFD